MASRPPRRLTLFRSSRALSLLSTAAVGLSLASCTGVFFGIALSGFGEFGNLSASTGLPTLLMGTLWNLWLRRRPSLDRGSMYVRSTPFAAINAGLIGMLWLPNPVVGLLFGLSIGALLWMPSLIMTVLVFGEPVLWSRQQARLGLDGAERGETLVGGVCTLLSWLSLFALFMSHHVPSLGTITLRPVESGLVALSLLGLVASLVTTAMALSRGRRRHALINAAASGERPDYRVEHTPAGRVLLRVHAATADDYRQADTDEFLFALDPELTIAPETTSKR